MDMDFAPVWVFQNNEQLDTPIHLTARIGSLSAFIALNELQRKTAQSPASHSPLEIRNKEGLTPVELARSLCL